MKAGLVDFVEPDQEIAEGVWLEPTPGHTPGHVSVHVSSEGEEAIITGDLMHHPVQFAVPDIPGNFCMDKPLSCKTRRNFMEKYADKNVFVIGSHFSDPTAGWIIRDGENFRLKME